MERTTQQDQTDRRPAEQPPSPERPPIWANTSPRANAELDPEDVNRGVERLEALLGR